MERLEEDEIKNVPLTLSVFRDKSGAVLCRSRRGCVWHQLSGVLRSRVNVMVWLDLLFHGKAAGQNDKILDSFKYR